MLKNNKIAIMVILLVVVILLILILFSYINFNTYNPFTTLIGIINIMTTDIDYVVIQENPQVILAKPDNSNNTLNEYMNEKGYEEIEEERMGSEIVYSSNNKKEIIRFSVNKYFSKWVWEK